MAVYPQQIILKNSTATPAEIISAASTGGSEPLLRGELVLGIESGKVNLYAVDLNGQAQSIVPEAPGFDISGNSIYDLYDVSYGQAGNTTILPADGHVLQWDSTAGTFFNGFLAYSDITGAPTDLQEFTNNNNYFLNTDSVVSDLSDWNAEEPVDGDYIQWDATANQGNGAWIATQNITFDISGNSIFQLSNVEQINGYGNFDDPPSDKLYLKYNSTISAYQPSSIEIFDDKNPELANHLEMNGKNLHLETFQFSPRYNLQGSSVNKTFSFDYDTSNYTYPSSEQSSGVQWVPEAFVQINFKQPGIQNANVSQFNRSQGHFMLAGPRSLEGLVYVDDNGIPQTQLLNYRIEMPAGPTARAVTGNGETQGRKQVMVGYNVDDPNRVYRQELSGIPSDPNVSVPSESNPIEVATEWLDYSISGLTDTSVDPATLQNNDILVYNDQLEQWITAQPPPASVGGNSIGDLRDVNFDILQGHVEIEGMNKLAFKNGGFSTDDAGSGTEGYLGYFLERSGSEEYRGLTLAHFRSSDGLGSYVHVDRDRGIDLVSYSNVTRLAGSPIQIDNQPELRFESGNPFLTTTVEGVTTQTYGYVALRGPGAVASNFTYTLPVTPPSVENSVLTTDLDGNTSWTTITVSNVSINLDDLGDVDTSTIVPQDGQVLTWNNSASLWYAQDIPEPVSDLDGLTDVILGGSISQGQVLAYDGSDWTNQDIPQDWMLSSPGRAIYQFSTAANTQPPTGFLTFDTPSVSSATSLLISTNDSEGRPVGLNWSSIITTGVKISIVTRGDASSQVILGVTGNPTLNGTYFSIPVEALGVTGTFGLEEDLIVDLLAGGGGGGAGGALTLDELDDVSASPLTVQDGGALIYSSTAGEWVQGPSVPSVLDDLSDVDVTTVAPDPGQTIVWNGFSWVPGDSAGGGTSGGVATTRATVSATVGDVAPDTDAYLELTTIGSSGQFVDASCSKPAWVRFYPTAAARAADAGRLIDEDPTPGGGVLLEYLTVSDDEQVLITPGSVYYNNDQTLDERIYVAIRNLGNTTESIEITQTVYFAQTANINTGRVTNTTTLPIFPVGGSAFGTIRDTGKMGTFVSVQADKECRLVFYTSKDARQRDLDRPDYNSPLSSSGVLLEIIAESGVSYEITPARQYFNTESAEGLDELYVTAFNLGQSPSPLTISTVMVPIEGQILAAITGNVTQINGGTFGSG